MIMKFYLVDNVITPEHDINKDINKEILKQVYSQTEVENDFFHKIVISNTNDYILVKVGESRSHPMDDEEYIEFMMLEINDKIVSKIELNKNGEPNAIFSVDIISNNLIGSIVKIYVYCNKIGLLEKSHIIE